MSFEHKLKTLLLITFGAESLLNNLYNLIGAGHGQQQNRNCDCRGKLEEKTRSSIGAQQKGGKVPAASAETVKN